MKLNKVVFITLKDGKKIFDLTINDGNDNIQVATTSKLKITHMSQYIKKLDNEFEIRTIGEILKDGYTLLDKTVEANVREYVKTLNLYDLLNKNYKDVSYLSKQL